MSGEDTQATSADAALKAASAAEERRAGLAAARRVLEDARRGGDSDEIRLAEAELRTAQDRFREASQAAEDAKSAMDESFRDSDLQRLKPAEKPTHAALLIAAALFLPIFNLMWVIPLLRRNRRWDAAILVAPLPFLFLSQVDGAIAIAAWGAYVASPVALWLAVRRRRK